MNRLIEMIQGKRTLGNKRRRNEVESDEEEEPKQIGATVLRQGQEEDYQTQMVAVIRQRPHHVQKFNDFVELSTVKREITTWPDVRTGLETLDLFRDDKNNLNALEVLLEFAQDTFEDLLTYPTHQTVANLLTLSYNLTDPNDVYVFADLSREMTKPLGFYSIKELDNEPLLNEKIDHQIRYRVGFEDIYDIRLNIRALCFLAASYLRLYTKSAENYTLIQKHLKRQFNSFYMEEFPLENYEPSPEIVRVVKACLNNNDKIKNTFYLLLYAGETQTTGEYLKDFLYRIHVSYCGLHPVVLFLKTAELYTLTLAELANVLSSGEVDNVLTNIMTLFKKCADRTECKYGMYRFATIFEKKFYTSLQTRNCRVFTLIMAHLVRRRDGEGSKDILKIAQIQSLSEKMKLYAERYADLAYGYMLGGEMNQATKASSPPRN